MPTKSDGNGAVPRHLDEVDLISYLDGELEHAEQQNARAHLEGCWNCRSELLAVQNRIENFLRVRKQILPEELPPSGPTLNQFRRRLNEHQSAPVSARLSLRFGLWLRSFLPDLTPIRTYKKTALATGLAFIVLFALLVLPSRLNQVSADELLTRAGSYEFLNETPSGKVARTRVRLDRISLSKRSEKKIGEIDLAADSLTSSVYVAGHHASGAIDKRTVSHRDQLKDVNFFDSDFSPSASSYFAAQGYFPDVSVQAYRLLIGGRGLAGSEGAFTKRRGDLYELHHPFASSHPSGITETVFFVNAQSYAPASISIFATDGSDRIEYRFTRISFERVERTPEIAKLFEAPPSSVVSSSGKATPNTLNPTLESVSPLPSTAVASAELEVEVLRLLHQAGADLGEQVHVTRDLNGPVRVSGILDSDQRKSDILRALQPVADNPAVRIDLKTVAEALAERRENRDGSRATSVEGVEVEADTFPAYQDLRARMSDEEARVFAARMVSRSHSAMRHAWALKRLMSQFSARELANLQPEAHTKWIGLIKNHARAFENESRNLRGQLEPIFGAGGAGSAAGPITDDASLIRAVDRLVALAGTNYEVVRSAFTVTRNSSQFSAIKSPQFWQSLRSAEALAARIGER